VKEKGQDHRTLLRDQSVNTHNHQSLSTTKDIDKSIFALSYITMAIQFAKENAARQL
jgi:hypothetical protein